MPAAGSGQVGLRVGALDESLESRFHRRPSNQIAEDIDLPIEFRNRNRLDELLGCRRRGSVEFRELHGGSTSNSQGVSFRRKLAYKARRVRPAGIDAPAGEQDVSHNGVSEIALQPRYSSES